MEDFSIGDFIEIKQQNTKGFIVWITNTIVNENNNMVVKIYQCEVKTIEGKKLSIDLSSISSPIEPTKKELIDFFSFYFDYDKFKRQSIATMSFKDLKNKIKKEIFFNN